MELQILFPTILSHRYWCMFSNLVEYVDTVVVEFSDADEQTKIALTLRPLTWSWIVISERTIDTLLRGLGLKTESHVNHFKTQFFLSV